MCNKLVSAAVSTICHENVFALLGPAFVDKLVEGLFATLYKIVELNSFSGLVTNIIVPFIVPNLLLTSCE